MMALWGGYLPNMKTNAADVDTGELSWNVGVYNCAIPAQ